MIPANLSDEQKEQINEWVEENAEFEEGDLVTVDYDGTGIEFAGSEYGGIPMEIRKPTWNGSDVDRVSPSDLYKIKEHDDEHKLIELFDTTEEEQRKYGTTDYATVRIRYSLQPAVKNSVSDIRNIEESALVSWDEYDGELVIEPRDFENTTTIREGDDCPICGFNAEKISRWHPGPTSGMMKSCAVCGYVKERHDP